MNDEFNNNIIIKVNYELAKENGLFDHENDPVMYIIVNDDIIMDYNKIITQCCHSVSKITRINENLKTKTYSQWISSYESKIILKTSESNLLYCINNFADIQKDIWCVHILDLIKTDASPFSITAVAFNPMLIKQTPDFIKKFQTMQ